MDCGGGALVVQQVQEDSCPVREEEVVVRGTAPFGGRHHCLQKIRCYLRISSKWGVIYDTGSIEDDTKHPYDSSLTYSYRACPVTVAKILQSLYDDINNAPKYNFINLIGNNCSGRVCKWIEDGGLNAPFSSNIPGVKPVWNKGKKSYSPFH